MKCFRYCSTDENEKNGLIENDDSPSKKAESHSLVGFDHFRVEKRNNRFFAIFQQFYAQIVKKFRIMLRNYLLVAIQCLIPLVAISMGIVINRLNSGSGHSDQLEVSDFTPYDGSNALMLSLLNANSSLQNWKIFGMVGGLMTVWQFPQLFPE